MGTRVPRDLRLHLNPVLFPVRTCSCSNSRTTSLSVCLPRLLETAKTVKERVVDMISSLTDRKVYKKFDILTEISTPVSRKIHVQVEVHLLDRFRGAWPRTAT